MAKNVLLTTLSTLDFERAKLSAYFYEENTGEKIYCNGLSAQEPGSKYILSKYQIDQIVVVGTKQTINDSEDEKDEKVVSNLKAESDKYFQEHKNCRDEDLMPKDMSAFKFYKLRIGSFLSGEKWEDLSEYEKEQSKKSKDKDGKEQDSYTLYMNNKKMVPLDVNKERAIGVKFVAEQDDKEQKDNILGIVNTILGISTDPEEEICLYMDMQGGNRTSGFVRNAVVSILNNQTTSRVSLKFIVATNFNGSTISENEIVDETRRYKITDLVSGMNAFLRYGKADMIKQYCRELQVEETSPVGKLVTTMDAIDSAISLCNMDALVKKIGELKQLFLTQETFNKDNRDLDVFQILQDGIRRDYGGLLEDKKGDQLDYIDLIEWCTRKGLLQQALTLVEDKMPSYYFKKEWIKYDFGETPSNSKKFFLKKLGQGYESDNNKIFNNLYRCMECSNDAISKSRSDISGKCQTLKESLEKTAGTEKVGGDFSYRYCCFRELEGLLENVPYNSIKFYENNTNGRSNIYFYNGRPVQNEYYTVLYALEGKACRIINKKTRNAEVEVTVAIKTPKLDRKDEKQKKEGLQKLEDLFELHLALKKERNCCNHASEKGTRLSADVVRTALQEYIRLARELEAILR